MITKIHHHSIIINMAKVEDKLPRNINSIYTMIDGMPDIIFEHEQRPVIDPNQPHFMRRYTSQSLSNTIRAMGCQAPLNNSMAEWIFSFLQNCPGPEAAQILGSSSDIFRNLRTYSRGFLVLTRMQFHRLVCAALHVHMFRKVRYCVDFRLALDFTENRRFFIVLLSGAPGTGKSTIASLIASRMSVEHILSTDSIRHAMRTFYPQKDYPILYKSTYECGDLVDPDHTMSEEERVCFKMTRKPKTFSQTSKFIIFFYPTHSYNLE
ncbi:hypothetical protein TRFO_28236 [Tritrichomonas foetus]|uniref:Zeta toxin domain-containing protein n=1 Tax=Tritrichomonas foetus TaxID=1144522 RepID=A0A1J4JYR4_9EUKA|nr:hypothetical protein TRFO_28236 [Tritrichomonas foetus]|eukprot:OHT04297.1 hypothetical protein TRFO_28236 [Tritrichomonas foetus]